MVSVPIVEGERAPPPRPTRPRRLLPKLLYGAGSIAFGVKDNGFNVLLLIYYNQVLGLPPALAGAALALALVLDSFWDPLLGYISDNTHSKWGRRHPYMYAAAIPASLTYILLWVPPAGLGQTGLVIWLFCTTVLVRSFITLYEIPNAALAPELSDDYDERTAYMSYRYLFGWAGGVSMYVLAFSLFLRPTAAHPVGQLNVDGYRQYALTAAAIMFVSIVLSAAGTHRRIPELAPPPPRRRVPPLQIAREILGAIGNPSSVMLLSSGFVLAVATGIVFALQTYFSIYFWRLSSPQIAFIGFSSYIAALGALFLAPILSKRLGKREALILLTFVSAVLVPLPLILRLVGFFPANGSPALVPVLFVANIVATGLSIIPPILGASMMSDVVEDQQIKTGVRSEGVLFAAANVFLFKCVSGVGLLSGALVLSLARFPQKAQPGQVEPSVLVNLALIYAAIFVVLNVISVLLITRYRISRDQHASNLKRLESDAGGLVGVDARLTTPGPL